MISTTEKEIKTIPHIILQYAENLAFNWLLRDSAVNEPHYSLEDLNKLDARLEAEIDGLRIGGDAGLEICKEELVWEGEGEVFAAAVLTFESEDKSRIDEILELSKSKPELANGVISALGWPAYNQIEKYIYEFGTSDSPELKRIGIAAGSIHRHDPGQALIDAIKTEEPLLKARALKAVGELGRKDLLFYAQQNLNSQDEKCQFYAAWSTALFSVKAAIPVLQNISLQNLAYSEKAANMALRLMDLPTAQGWIKELATTPEHLRKAVIGTGAVGDPVLIPWLISLMANNDIARVAGEAFTLISGIDLAYDDLEGEWPEGFEVGPTEDPEDENIEMDADEDLPWPEPELIQKWWQENNSNFQNGTRYLIGKPITEESLQQVLRTGMQRQRAAAAIELAMRNPGQPLFEVRAPGFRQKQMLGLGA